MLPALLVVSAYTCVSPYQAKISLHTQCYVMRRIMRILVKNSVAFIYESVVEDANEENLQSRY